jgi:hypothetical protein
MEKTQEDRKHGMREGKEKEVSGPTSKFSPPMMVSRLPAEDKEIQSRRRYRSPHFSADYR